MRNKVVEVRWLVSYLDSEKVGKRKVKAVGACLLHNIEKRCRKIFRSLNNHFGGINIYFVGDFQQLPPVSDSPVTMVHFIQRII